jgi:hypothetical protein
MTITKSDHTRPQSRKPGPTAVVGGRRNLSARPHAGYLAAIVVNGALLLVVDNLMAWELLPFLTDDYDRVLPAVRLALMVAMSVNFLRLWYAPPWFVTLTDMVSTAFGLVAAVWVFRVFPFEFTSPGVRWDLVMRAGLIAVIAGALIALIVAPLRLLSSLDQADA